MNKNIYRITIVLSFIFGFCIRLYHLAYLDLWRDESFSVNVAKFPIKDVIDIAAKDTQPPLHLGLLHYWMAIFSESEFSVRFLSLIFGMLTILFVYLISRIVFKKRIYVLLATLFACSNPILIVYSQEARSYTMLTAFAAGAVFFALNLNLSGKWYNYLGFILMSFAGLYTHNIFIFVMTSIFVMRIFEFIFAKKIPLFDIIFLKNGYVRQVLLSYIIIGVLYIPWLLVFIKQFTKVDNEGFWLTFDPINDPRKNYPWFFVSQSYDSNFKDIDFINNFLIRFLGIPLSIIGMGFEIIKTKRKLPKITILTLSMFVFVYIISFKTPFFYVRYLIFITPLLMILVAFGIMAIDKLVRVKVAFILGIILIVASTLFFLTNISQFKSKSAYKKAISEISFNQETDVILEPHAATFHSFNYYSKLPNYIYDPERDIAYFEGLAYIKEENYFNGNLIDYKRVWIVNYWRDQSLEDKLLGLGFIKSKATTYDGGLYVELWVFEKENQVAEFNLN